MAAGSEDGPPRRLDEIGTDWNRVADPSLFVTWYATAIRAYLAALVRDPAEADEIAQQVLLRVMQGGFAAADPGGGRFRDYLKAALRNAARTHLRRKAAGLPVEAADLDGIAAADGDADRAWVDEWRGRLLARVWDVLAAHEARAPGKLPYTVLKLHLDHPDEDSEQLAGRAAAKTGTPLRADAYRKRLSRARRLFAEYLVREVSATAGPAREQVVEELAALGLLHYVRDYLPQE